MSENLATILTETAERLPEQTAFKLDDVELNYSMLDEGSARVELPVLQGSDRPPEQAPE